MPMTIYDSNKCVINTKPVKVLPVEPVETTPAYERIQSKSVGYVVSTNEEYSVVFVVGKGKHYQMSNAVLKSINPKKYAAYGKDKNPREKICLTCHRLLPHTEFPYNQNNKKERVRRPHCKPCYKKIQGKNISSRAKEKFKRQIGAPAPGDLWRCEVCYKHSIAEVNVQTRVDHDHKTGNPRAIICDSCNTGIGRLQNGQDLLGNALRYVQKHDAKQKNRPRQPKLEP